MDNSLYSRILSLIPLFRTLTPEELQEILKISKLLRVNAGVTVLAEGDEGSAMYVLIEGKVAVVKRLPGGDTAELATLSAPSHFGEMSLIDRFPRSASVVTTMQAILYQVDLKAFNQLRVAYHPAAYKILRGLAPDLCSRLRSIDDRIGEFFKNPESNLADVEQRFLERALAGDATLGPNSK